LLLSYFSRPPHPPTPPLFPYTTLFRSRAPVRQAEAGEDLVEDEDDVAFPGELAETFEVVSFRHDHARAAQDRLHDQGSDLVFVFFEDRGGPFDVVVWVDNDRVRDGLGDPASIGDRLVSVVAR